MALNTTQLERYYNAPIGRVYAAMKRYLEGRSRFTLKSADDLSCSCTFSSGVSMTTWGERLTASAVPSGDGTLVRLTVAGKVGSTAVGFQNSHNVTIADEFFTGVSSVLAGDGSEKPSVETSPDPGAAAVPDTDDERRHEGPADDPVIPEPSSDEGKTPREDPHGSALEEARRTDWSAIWEKHHTRIIIAVLSVVAVVLCSAIAVTVYTKDRNERRLAVVREVADVCDRDDAITVLNTGDHASEPAVRMVWSNVHDKEIVECIAANTGMSDETIDAIGNSKTSDDDSSTRWDDWQVSWTLDDDTTYATITVQYSGNGNAFETKATLADFADDGEGDAVDVQSQTQPFTIGLDCYVTSGDELDLSTNRERIYGVTSQNFRNLVWNAGKSISCNASGKDSTATGVRSDTDLEAMKTAYGDRADSTEYGMGALYGECASTAFIPMGVGTMSEDQAKSLLGALVLCPDHPRAGEIRQKAEADIARQAEIRDKRQQGLIKDDGTYTVPDEMSTGTWRTMADKVTDCYWEMQDANGQTIDNNFVSSGIAQTVTIPNGVAGFTSQGCGEWEKQ
ncbi:hypothetical protein [Bifidobacterium tissieri]|uniref:hypothetical protein n=1 Tax=Bifidobacterium tissieri TaxID=1630162 RepID=UPI00123BD037|nr:hypothetical protein [Bifidobacterium tissieri]KAA8830159.1 hypothetical protein EM849_10295 [Bifidobacterium tissieri]